MLQKNKKKKQYINNNKTKLYMKKKKEKMLKTWIISTNCKERFQKWKKNGRNLRREKQN